MSELTVRCVRCRARRPIGEGPCPNCGAPPLRHKSDPSDLLEHAKRLDRESTRRPAGEPRRDR